MFTMKHLCTNHINDVKSAKYKKSFVVIKGGNDKWEKFSIPGSNKNYVAFTQMQQYLCLLNKMSIFMLHDLNIEKLTTVSYQ